MDLRVRCWTRLWGPNPALCCVHRRCDRTGLPRPDQQQRAALSWRGHAPPRPRPRPAPACCKVRASLGAGRLRLWQRPPGQVQPAKPCPAPLPPSPPPPERAVLCGQRAPCPACCQPWQAALTGRSACAWQLEFVCTLLARGGCLWGWAGVVAGRCRCCVVGAMGVTACRLLPPPAASRRLLPPPCPPCTSRLLRFLPADGVAVRVAGRARSPPVAARALGPGPGAPRGRGGGGAPAALPPPPSQLAAGAVRLPTHAIEYVSCVLAAGRHCVSCQGVSRGCAWGAAAWPPGPQTHPRASPSPQGAARPHPGSKKAIC